MMRNLLLGIFTSLLLAACSGNSQKSENAISTTLADSSQNSKTEKTIMTNFHSFKANYIDGTEVELSRYKGREVWVINVASMCGYTPQYAELEKIHRKYSDEIAIIGFPANNFGGQEPGSNQQIVEFCTKNYNITFQLYNKISVKGEDQHPLYKWLSEQAQQEPQWNFCKYIIDKEGNFVKYYNSKSTPTEILKERGKSL